MSADGALSIELKGVYIILRQRHVCLDCAVSTLCHESRVSVFCLERALCLDSVVSAL